MYGYELAVYQNSNPLLGSSKGCNLKTICSNTGAKKSKHVCNIYFWVITPINVMGNADFSVMQRRYMLVNSPEIYIKFAYADRLSAPTVQPLRISTVGIKGKCFVLKEWALRLILTKENI